MRSFAQVEKPLRAVGSLYWLEDPVLGFALLGTMCLHPSSAVGGLLAARAGLGFSQLLFPERMSREPEVLNAGLWGLLLGAILPLSFRLGLLALLGGVLVAGLTFTLAEALYRKRGSGVVLSLPFAIATLVTCWMLPDPLPLAGELPSHFPEHFLSSLSLITFVPHPVTGGLLLALVFRKSPWLAILAFIGYLGG